MSFTALASKVDVAYRQREVRDRPAGSKTYEDANGTFPSSV